ncbi:hypothetical protein BGZ90_001823 [Linnemannia elongata]|nr:hypothetical protein BGZ90_001823 [Linnemannia elongata]
MAGLKYELDQWNEGVIAFDQGLYEDALEIFEPIADSAKIHFNIGVVLTTLGDFEGASAAFTRATNLDQFLAIAYFQNGVANVALEDYGKALSCFHDAFLYLRGNMVIDYTQLGLDFKLYSCQVLFNRALCYLELGEHDLGMTDMWRATREKQTKAHDLLDQALRDKGKDCTVFTVPQGVLYRPAESKVKNAKKKDYLGNSKVIAALDSKDAIAGFQGKSAWQVQMSGPTNVAAVEEPRPMTPPVAGKLPFVIVTDDDMVDDLDQHVYALSIESQEITIVDKPSTATPFSKAPSNTSSTDIRVSPIPTRSNSTASRKGSILRKTSQNSGYSSSSSPPMPSSILPHQPTYNSDYTGTSPPSRTGTPPVFSDLRRMGSNGKNGATGLWRGDSVRSTTSGGSGGSSGAYFQQQPNHGDHHMGFMNGSEGTYLDEPVYAGLRNKLRVKCHYIDTRAVLVRADTPLEELIQRIQEKFQADRPLKLRYKDEDQHMLSMVDDEDWLMAQQVHMETTGSLDRMELWCFDEE